MFEKISYRFEDPLMLFFLLIIPVLGFYHYKREKQRSGSIVFSHIKILKDIPPSPFLKFRHFIWISRLTFLSILIISLARPQSGRTETEILTQGIDIMLAIDISGSMKAEDFKPKNRFHIAKEVVKEFIQGRKNDRIGMVVFASKSYTQCPLTLDYGILLSFLDQINIGLIEDGTAIGMALSNCVNRLRNSDAKSKIIILLTDGRNNTGKIDPQTAADIAKTMGIKIYTVAAGKKGQAPYPVEDPFFGKRYVMMDVEIDEQTLLKIAQTTGGKYFRAEDPEALHQIYKHISELEKTEIKTKDYTNYKELFQWLFIPIMLLLFLEIWLRNKRFRRLT